jgi:hypothetical protein
MSTCIQKFNMHVNKKYMSTYRRMNVNMHFKLNMHIKEKLHVNIQPLFPMTPLHGKSFVLRACKWTGKYRIPQSVGHASCVKALSVCV